MEISPKLTSASSLNATVTNRSTPDSESSTSALKNAANNNSDAAADIARLSSSQDSAAVAAANLSSSRVSADDVDNLAKNLGERIKGNPTEALGAISTKVTPSIVQALLS